MGVMWHRQHPEDVPCGCRRKDINPHILGRGRWVEHTRHYDTDNNRGIPYCGVHCAFLAES